MTSLPNHQSCIDVRDYPAIDNHAHPHLTQKNKFVTDSPSREPHPRQRELALDDLVHMLAHVTARRVLVQLYDLPPYASCEDITALCATTLSCTSCALERRGIPVT